MNAPAGQQHRKSPKPLRPDKGLVPPNNLDAEASVLSAILLEANVYELVQDKLGLQHFYADAHRSIYEAMGLLQDVRQPIDAVSVANKLRDMGRLRAIGGIEYIAQIVDATPAIVNVEAHAAIVIQHARVRRMIASLRHYAALGYATPDAQEYLDEVEGQIAEIARSDDVTRGLVQAVEHTETMLEKLAQADRLGKPIGTLTGFTRFDDLTGGLRAGLYIVAARPGMGKTAFAMNVATNIASESTEAVTDDRGVTETVSVPGGGVAFFSMEMTAEQLTLRAISSHQRFDSKYVLNGKIRPDNWTRLVNGAAWLSRLPLYIDETPILDMRQLRSRARRLQADLLRSTDDDAPSKGLQLIVVDYLQIMGGWRKVNQRESREEFIAECARSLKSLSKELNVPVICLAQLNRDAAKRKIQGHVQPPQLEDLRESGAIEQEADMVLFLHRDDYYDADSEERGIAKLVVAKHRGGSTGSSKVRWEATYTRFDNLAPEEYDEFDGDFESPA